LILKRHIAYIVFFFISQFYIFLTAGEILTIGAKAANGNGGWLARWSKVIFYS